MQYTFIQAQKRLAGRTNGFGGTDVKEAINDAIQALSGLQGWECLRKVLRFSSVGPGLTLPQGTAGLVRVCVNGKPTTVRGQDFRFIQSGPGDLRVPPPGFDPLRPENVLDNGFKPVIIEPKRPFKIFAYSDATDQPYVTVRGISPEGRDIRVNVAMTASPVYNSSGTLTSGTEPGSATASTEVFQNVTEVTLDDSATAYVTLYAADAATDERFPIAVYHPYVKAPRFRNYILAGIRPDQPVDLLAEVRIEPLPLVNDTDVVPFDTLEPIEWMMRSAWCMQSGEVDQSIKYQDRAEKWLKSFEVTDDTHQTSVVVNNVYANSLGELSMDAWNI